MQHTSVSSPAASPQFTRPKVDTETTAQQPKPAEPLTPPATEKKGKAGTPAPAPAATTAPHHQAVSGSAEPLSAAQAASKNVATKAPCGSKTSAAVVVPSTTTAPGTLARVAPSSTSVAAEQTEPVTAPQPSAGPPGPHPPAGAPSTPRHSQHPVKTTAPQSSSTPRAASTSTTSAIVSLSLTSALDQSSVASPSPAPLEAAAPASAQGAAKSNVAMGVEPTMSAALQGRGSGAKPAAPAALATPVAPHPSPAHPAPPPAKPDICSTPLIQPAATPLIEIPAEPSSSPGSRSSSLFSADSVADFEAASSPGSPRSSLSPRQLVNRRPEAPRQLAPVISFSAAQGQMDLMPSASALALEGPTAPPAPQLDFKPALHRPPRRNRHSGSVDGALPSFRPASCGADTATATPQQQGGLQPDGAPASWFQLSLDLAKELELDPDFAQLGKGGRLPLGVDSPRPTSLRHSPGGSSVTTPALTTSPGPSPPRPLRVGQQQQQQGGPQGGERPTPRLGPHLGAGGADVVKGEPGGGQSFSPSSLPLPDSGWRPPAAARKLPIPDPRQVILLAEPVTGREGLGGNTMPNAPRGRRRQQQQQLGAGGEASAGRLPGAGQGHAGGLQPGLAMQRLDGTWVTLPPKPVEPGPGRTSPASPVPSSPSPPSAPQPALGAGQQPPGQGPGPGQQGVSSPGAREGGAQARGAGPHPSSPTSPQPWAGAGPSGGGGPGALPIVLTPVPGAGPDPWSGPGAGGWAPPLGAAGPSPAGGAAAANALGPGGCNVWVADQDPALSSSGGGGEAAKLPADEQGGLGSGQGAAGGGAAAGSGGADQLTLTQAELGVSLLACAAGAEARLWAGARRPGQLDSPGPPAPAAAAAHAVPAAAPLEQATGVVVANVPAAGPEPSNKPSSPSPPPSSSPKHKAAPPRPSSPNPAPALLAPHPPHSPAPSRDPRQLSTMAHRRPPSPIPDSSDGKCPKLPLVVPAPLPPPAACVIPAATSAPSHPGHTLNHTPLAGQQHHTTPATAGSQTWVLTPAPAQRMADAANMTLPQDPHKALPGHQAPARAHLGPPSPSAMQAPSLVAHAKSDGAKATVLPSLVKSGSGQREGAGVRLGCSSSQNDVMGLMRFPPAHAGPGGDNMF